MNGEKKKSLHIFMGGIFLIYMENMKKKTIYLGIIVKLFATIYYPK